MYQDAFEAVCNAAKAKTDLFKKNPLGYFVSAMVAGMFIAFGAFISNAAAAPFADAQDPIQKFMNSMTFSAALQDPGNKMLSRHQVDIGRPFFLKFQKNLCQPFFADLFSKTAIRKFPVLAENTAQRTAGKKYRPGASCSGNTGFFPHMKRCSSHTEHGIFPTCSFFAGKTIRMALSRTKRTALIKLVLQVFTFFYFTPFFRTFNRRIFSTDAG